MVREKDTQMEKYSYIIHLYVDIYVEWNDPIMLKIGIRVLAWVRVE